MASHDFSMREKPLHILVEKPINVFPGKMMSGIFGAQERWIKHYSSAHSILLVGDGDFSFSLCLGMAFGTATNIIATSLDTYDVLINKYKNASANVAFLKSLGGDRVAWSGRNPNEDYSFYRLQEISSHYL
ncbi:hypothetical protein ACS0TY_033256 [Phlomoides rotata]